MLFSAPLPALLAAIAAGATPTGSEATRPVSLITERIGNEVVIKVIGSSRTPTEATYELEAIGGPPGSSNTSVQRGSAHISPDRVLTLIKLKIGNVAGGTWRARLRVQIAGGSVYEEVASS